MALVVGGRAFSMGLAVSGIMGSGTGALAQPKNASGKPEPSQASESDYEVLEVGPGKRFTSLTAAGCFMNSSERWNGGYKKPEKIAKMGFRVIVSPEPREGRPRVR